MDKKKKYLTVKEFLLLSNTNTMIYIDIVGNGFLERYITEGVCLQQDLEWRIEKGYLSFKGTIKSKPREFVDLNETTLMKRLTDMYGDSVEISCYVLEDKTIKTIGYFSLVKKSGTWAILISEEIEKVVLSDMSKKLINYLENSFYLFAEGENNLYDILDQKIDGIEDALYLLVVNGFEFSPNLNKDFLFVETYEELIDKLKTTKEFMIKEGDITDSLDEDNINKILDKIKLVGLDKLSNKEKQTLEKYSNI